MRGAKQLVQDATLLAQGEPSGKCPYNAKKSKGSIRITEHRNSDNRVSRLCLTPKETH